MQFTKKRLGLVAVAGIAATFALTPLGASAADLIDSGDIKDQTIQSRDIAAEGVGTSEIRNQTIQSGDIGSGGVKTSEIKDGQVFHMDLSKGVWGMIEDAATTAEAKGYAAAAEEAAKGHANTVADSAENAAKGYADENDTVGMNGLEAVGRADSTNTGKAESKCKSENQATNDKAAVSGGYKVVSGDVTITGSYPSSVSQTGEKTDADPAGLWVAKGWTVTWKGDGVVEPWVVCANIG